jgi:ABC-type lipoprotein release transport system permease subunit
MSEVVIVSLISLFGTLFGTFAGIVTSSKLSNYRIEQLENKVQKHNNLIERMYNVENRVDNVETKMSLLHKDCK